MPITMKTANLRLLVAGLAGGAGVSLGALGSHAFMPRMDVAQHRQYNVANQYHILHSVAMAVVAVAIDVAKAKGDQRTAGLFAKAWSCFAVGTAVMATSRYVHCVVHKPDWLVSVAPLGGLVLVAGWGFVAAAGFA